MFKRNFVYCVRNACFATFRNRYFFQYFYSRHRFKRIKKGKGRLFINLTNRYCRQQISTLKIQLSAP